MRGKTWDLKKRYAAALSTGSADEERLLGKIQRKHGWDSGRAVFNQETVDFAHRVLADGGADIEDINFLDQFITNAKANGYYDDIVAAYSPSWGVKGVSTASKLYSIIGAGQDLGQTTGANQPTINLVDLNSRTRLLFDGTSDYLKSAAFTLVQPETILMGGFEQETHTNNDRFFDGSTSNSGSASQLVPTAPRFSILAPSQAATNDEATLNSPFHIRFLFNTTSSATQVNDNAEKTGDAGSNDMGGFTLGAKSDGTAASNVSVGMVVILNSIIDANYAAKMAAIYAFSKAAYGTP